MDATLLEMRGIGKSFPGVRALQDVSLEVRAGEVHSLVGENGAGKSTLIRILGGIYPRDAGEILLHGSRVEIGSPTQARQLGITIIHQELNQVPALSVAENIFLGREPRRPPGLMDWDQMYARAGRLLAGLGLSIDPRRRVGTLTVAEQQLVEIAKALSADAGLVVMDEPTAALTVEETERLFRFIRDLRARGVGIIYITHRLEEIFKIADRVTVLRDGQRVGTYTVAELTMDELIRPPADAIALGIGLVTEDRKRLGLVLPMSVRANITLPVLRRLRTAFVVRRADETALIRQAIHDLDMAVTSPEQIVRNLSGGTQQKVVVSKWLQTRARVLLMVEPTRGIDVGAKVEIYRLMTALARRGVGIVMVSSEMEEVLGMSDRILVMHEGVITAEFPRAQATQEAIMASAAGRVRRGV